METIALLEFDIKYGPTIVQSSGEIEIPTRLVNWALQALQDDSYSTGTMNGYFYGGVKFSLRNPMTEDRGGRRSFSFLLISENEILEFRNIAEKILEWVHTRIDGEVRQIEHLEAILRQLADQDVIMATSSREEPPKPNPQPAIPEPIVAPILPINPIETVPEKKFQQPQSELTGNHSYEQVMVKSVHLQSAFSGNNSSRLTFEEKQIPLLSFIACHWVDTTKQVKVRLQIGKHLPSRHLRILTMFSLGCEKDRETINLSFGRFFVRRLNGNIVLIGQPIDNIHDTESKDFFEILGSVLAHFPEQVTFFLNLYRKNQSVFLSCSQNLSEKSWKPNNNVEKFYVRGLERLISHMSRPLSLQNLVETLMDDYSLLEVLYMIVVLNDIGMVEIHTKKGISQNNPQNPETI
ncbi:MAG: hypothetical protein ACFFDT_34165 [Candidatus Hodarchaeota archaeon]